jgi:hypothetical protein
VIPLRVVKRGYRVAYEPGAVAYEDAHEMGGFSRRVRIMTGNFEQLRELPAVLTPLRPMELFFFLSHKVGRLAVPFCLLVAATTNLLLLPRPLYVALGVSQMAFYGLAALGATIRLRPKMLRLPYYFTMINLAAFLGFYFAYVGGRRPSWKSKEQTSTPAVP